MYTGFRIKSITEYTFIRVTREHHLTKLLIFPVRIYSGKHTIKKKNKSTVHLCVVFITIFIK